MLKETYVWLVFIVGIVVLAACSPMTEKTGGGNSDYDINSIKEKLEQLGPDSDILYGKELFDNTKEELPENVGNELSCMSCHGEGGLNDDSPMVGVTERYPRERDGEMTSIEERVNGCFIRSENGKKLDEDSEELQAMVRYLEFISEDVENEDGIDWRMTNEMDEVPEPDVDDGEELFTDKNCLSCHGTEGEGTSDHTGPPLWGDDSFNAAAGMNKIEKASGFIQNNMPKGYENTLTDQEAADLAAYVLSHKRPEGDPDIVGDSHHDEDDTYIFDERREKIRKGEFDWTSLDSVEDK